MFQAYLPGTCFSKEVVTGGWPSCCENRFARNHMLVSTPSQGFTWDKQIASDTIFGGHVVS